MTTSDLSPLSRRSYIALLAAFCSLLLILGGCGGGSAGTGDRGYSGRLLDVNGIVVANATVELNEVVTNTDENGDFSTTGMRDEVVLLRVTNGNFTATLTLTNLGTEVETLQLSITIDQAADPSLGETTIEAVIEKNPGSSGNGDGNTGGNSETVSDGDSPISDRPGDSEDEETDSGGTTDEGSSGSGNSDRPVNDGKGDGGNNNGNSGGNDGTTDGDGSTDGGGTTDDGGGTTDGGGSGGEIDSPPGDGGGGSGSDDPPSDGGGEGPPLMD